MKAYQENIQQADGNNYRMFTQEQSFKAILQLKVCCLPNCDMSQEDSAPDESVVRGLVLKGWI